MEMEALPSDDRAAATAATSTTDSKPNIGQSGFELKVPQLQPCSINYPSSKDAPSTMNWPMASTKRILLYGVVLLAIEHLIAASLLCQDLLLHFVELWITLLYVATLSFIPILIVVLGIYGSLKDCKLSLLVFSCLITLSALFNGIFIVFALSSDAFSQTEFYHNLNESMKHYQWSLDDSTSVTNHTTVWDETQKLGCCGMNTARDWDAYRPPDLSTDDDKIPKYPRTCCPDNFEDQNHHPYCDEIVNLYHTGCKTLLVSHMKPLLWLHFFAVLFQLMLAALAHMVCFESDAIDVVPSRQRAWSRFTIVTPNPVTLSSSEFPKATRNGPRSRWSVV